MGNVPESRSIPTEKQLGLIGRQLSEGGGDFVRIRHVDILQRRCKGHSRNVGTAEPGYRAVKVLKGLFGQ